MSCSIVVIALCAVGEDEARTSVHADLFDNLYVVVRGQKQFTLLPPAEGHALGRRPFRGATWVLNPSGSGLESSGCSDLSLELDEPPDLIPWTDLDFERDGSRLQPIHATLRAGETLFLPALWWHAVSQSAKENDNGDQSTIAINFWYEGPAICTS